MNTTPKKVLAYHYKMYGINVPVIATSYEKSVVIAFDFLCNPHKLQRYLDSTFRNIQQRKLLIVNL